MTKEEIFRKYLYPVTEEDGRLTRAILDCMQEYADQETERLKAELNELKERHKKDVEEAYKHAQQNMFSSNSKEAFMTGEQYYKQKFESND